jgi:hypothetical protein
MPHKRAKRTVREQQRKERSALTFKHFSSSYFPRGTDLAPPGANSTTEGIPKSVSRVLDAARIRAEYRLKKRARLLEEDGGADAPTTLAKAKKRRRRGTADTDQETTTIEIKPGESLKHFNQCAFVTCFLLNPFSLLFFFLQESRGPHASAGAIRNAYFCCNRAQGEEISCYDRSERDCTPRVKGGGGGYDIYSRAAPRPANGVRDDFERQTASSQRYRDCTASAKEATARSCCFFFQLGRHQASYTDEGRGRAFDGSTRDDGDGTGERHSTVSRDEGT